MPHLFETLSLHPTVVALSKGQGRFQVDDTLGVSLMLASAYSKKPRRYALITTNIYNAQRVYDLLSSFVGEEACLFYPSDELLRAESIAASKEMMAQRLYVMDQLLSGKPKILITHAAAAMRFLPDPRYFDSQTLLFNKGKSYDIERLKVVLTQSGYARVNKIDQSLQFAVRGAIIDIASVNNAHPIRLEFFGDELESIRYFDIATQASFDQMEQVRVLPASDILFAPQDVANLRRKMAFQLEDDRTILGYEAYEHLRTKTEADLARLENFEYHHSLYKYLGYAQTHHHGILDYAPDAIALVANDDQLKASSTLLVEEAFNYFNELFEHGQLLSHLGMYRDIGRVLGEHHPVLINEPFSGSDKTWTLPVYAIISAANNVRNASNLIQSYLYKVDKLVLAIATPQQLETILELLKETGVEYEHVEGMVLPKGKLGIAQLNLEEGFELPEQRVAYLTSQELFGYRSRVSRFMNRYKEATILKSYDELHPGDYVVHETSGIGQFVGIQTIEVDGIHRDYLQIAYAGSDVLYVPLAQFNLVRKYGAKEGATPRLNRLNSSEWEKTKRKIKERVNDLAERLLALYKERANAQGFAFAPDDQFQRDFEKRFPFELTPDQQKSLEEIKQDMEKPMPMDRLLCGDVGFGKTEVAMRAAFKAISNGKQVAFLCPTTLLARQHYEVAQERFAHFGVNIAILSRLIPEADQRRYISDIREGRVHLIIGTHRLLSKEIKYLDLGLLIVDEEQRFGVEQKEQIKELKSNVDVLTLTATPIPRTLQISLLGIRQLSQLNTPPVHRMPIQTYVMAYNKAIIKELIERELGRQGQVFYLHNNVSTIDGVAKKLGDMIHNARIGIVHGQMLRDDIEDVMVRFYGGDLNLLVCTSIIENGIDIANANLIIVEDAQNFGLSQLYQIKGRVGRGNRIAFAYLLYREHKVINETAAKRLKAIQDFTELGSGYKIAQRDLMIRGAGDILGPEQAGFIDSVGIDMYLQLLNEAILEKQTGVPTPPPETPVSLAIDAYIPQAYADNPDKIELYQDIDKAKTNDDIKTIREYIRDLYGRIPSEVDLLLRKRQFDLHMKHPAFDNIKETKQYVDLQLSREFVLLNKAGTLLFERSQLIMPLIRINYQNRELKIRLFKKGQWFENLEDLMVTIANVYDELAPKNETTIPV
ncbi:MAG TPA: transcription-repair coupling factor [Bacilli bacterium]|nr:transcription-repair coupling factor [Bacilli bacterium]